MELAALLTNGRNKGASDIHLLPGEYPVYRINGRLLREPGEIITKDRLMKFLGELLPEEKRACFFREKEADFAWTDEACHRYRINAHIQRGNPALSIRILKDKIPPLADLGLPDSVKDLLNQESGLILVTGATGSGKSTTLAAMVEELNISESLNIITMEDPVEYVFESKNSIIRQREIGSDTDSFRSALKSALRQDPDVILVGEMRDLESIEAVITIAETGHLVLGTLHTMGAVAAVDRIIDVFPEEKQNQIRLQISGILRGILNQRLIPGTDGRLVLACEILLNTSAVASYILQGKTNQILSVLETGRKSGMISMERALENLYKNHKISQKEYEKHRRIIL